MRRCPKRKNIFVNAPTGIGKTDAAISACVSFASDKEIPIFFLTPKNSQHKIAVEVLSGLRKKYNAGIKYVDIVGKRNLCVNPDINMLESRRTFLQNLRATGGKKEVQLP